MQRQAEQMFGAFFPDDEDGIELETKVVSTLSEVEDDEVGISKKDVSVFVKNYFPVGGMMMIQVDNLAPMGGGHLMIAECDAARPAGG